jgi:hypothetical protein
VPVFQVVWDILEVGGNRGAQTIGYIVRNETVGIPDCVERAALEANYQEKLECEGNTPTSMPVIGSESLAYPASSVRT